MSYDPIKMDMRLREVTEAIREGNAIMTKILDEITREDSEVGLKDIAEILVATLKVLKNIDKNIEDALGILEEIEEELD